MVGSTTYRCGYFPLRTKILRLVYLGLSRPISPRLLKLILGYSGELPEALTVRHLLDQTDI